jgi:hypothetical protein
MVVVEGPGNLRVQEDHLMVSVAALQGFVAALRLTVEPDVKKDMENVHKSPSP